MNNKRDLIRRCMWSIFILLIVEVGRQLVIPVVDISSAEALLQKNRALQFFGYATGGQMSVPTLFSLGIAPYMTSKILWSVFTMVNPEGTQHLTERTSNVIQRCLTLAFALAQALQMALMIQKTVKPVTIISQFDSLLILVFTLTAGAMLVVWLADVNTGRGIGGAVLLIVPTVVQNLPNMLENGPNSNDHFIFTPKSTATLIASVIVFLIVAIFIYQAELRIEVERTSIINSYGKSYIPVRLLPGGAMPFMFSISLFVLPTYLRHEGIGSYAVTNFIINQLFSYHTYYGIAMYSLVVCILGYGFGFVNFQPSETARHLKESGDYIYNVIPGRETEKYLTHKLLIMIFAGNCFLVAVTAIPLIIGLYVPGYGNLAFFFSGLFILVTILDNLFDQIRALYFKGQYDLI
ncbi:accessory Sec system protein translocase subunit SecY2 [Secundilactobacillus similis DSM 23365 = JCM 2765]|uniref:Protein translocase subunit secY sec61 alpha n=1 Tax=Secundilactobacillus similis DSM 23365 = JCM 2765 TaxID=1423804 RepID=A0A0R2FLJ1_9LACO|nr:hypothetical protein [Secundilactobacillus similis]KRN25706.1 protein translocase subunit secY sec61 alpha [Secundilactobacillus similis DSM 23365 = JCM 2765]